MFKKKIKAFSYKTNKIYKFNTKELDYLLAVLSKQNYYFCPPKILLKLEKKIEKMRGKDNE